MTGCPGTDGRQDPDEELIREFGLLLSATNRLERIAGKAFEQDAGITHAMFEMLRRLNEGCTSMSHLAKEMIFTSCGVTRLIDRMEAAGLVERTDDPGDRRGRLVRLTPLGEQTAVRATLLHRDNLRRLLADQLPAEHWDRFAEDMRVLSHAIEQEVPRLR
jgi:DNA-binding MarR family transcriptional regulator